VERFDDFVTKGLRDETSGSEEAGLRKAVVVDVVLEGVSMADLRVKRVDLACWMRVCLASCSSLLNLVAAIRSLKDNLGLEAEASSCRDEELTGRGRVRETSLALRPLSIPSNTRAGEVCCLGNSGGGMRSLIGDTGICTPGREEVFRRFLGDAALELEGASS